VRIFLQAGHRDLGWGGHNPNHAGVVLPDALRWVFRDARADPSAGGFPA
jgi:hypothetical protein